MEQIVKSEENLSRAKSLEVHHEPPPPRKCPRCDSSNTKFCYYNNYSHAQPRYLCKACRRYWTHGGSLRNVPIGGGCRKNRRLKNAMSEVSISSSSVISPAQSLPIKSQNYQGLSTGNNQGQSSVSDGQIFGANVQGFNQSLIPPIMPLSSWSVNVGFGGAANESYSFWNATTTNNIRGSSTADLDFSMNPNPWFNH